MSQKSSVTKSLGGGGSKGIVRYWMHGIKNSKRVGPKCHGIMQKIYIFGGYGW